MGSAREVALLTLTDMDRRKAWSDARLKKPSGRAGWTAGTRRWLPGFASASSRTASCWTTTWGPFPA